MDSGTQQQTSTTDYPDWLKRIIQPMANQGAAQFAAGAPDPYSGETVAQFTPEQLKSQQMMTGLADNMGETLDPMKAAYKKSLTGANPYTKYMEGGNPYLDQMVGRAQKSMADVFNTDVMTNIRDEAIGSGQQIGAGQSTYGAGIDVGTKNLLEAQGGVATNMYGSAYDADMNRQLEGERLGLDTMVKGMSLTPQMMTASMMPGQIYAGVGGDKQKMGQTNIDADIAKYFQKYNLDTEHLMNFAKLFTGMNPGGTTTTEGPAPNKWAQALGGGAQGVGMAGMSGGTLNPWMMGTAMSLPYLFQ